MMCHSPRARFNITTAQGWFQKELKENTGCVDMWLESEKKWFLKSPRDATQASAAAQCWVMIFRACEKAHCSLPSSFPQDPDIHESPTLTFLMWFLNKWDFRESLFMANIRVSFSSLCLDGSLLFLVEQEGTWGHVAAVKRISLLYFSSSVWILSSQIHQLDILETCSLFEHYKLMGAKFHTYCRSQTVVPHKNDP